MADFIEEDENQMGGLPSVCGGPKDSPIINEPIAGDDS